MSGKSRRRKPEALRDPPLYRICPACRSQGDRWKRGGRIDHPDDGKPVYCLKCPACGFELWGRPRPDVHPDGMEVHMVVLPSGEVLSGSTLLASGQPALEDQIKMRPGARVLDSIVVGDHKPDGKVW